MIKLFKTKTLSKETWELAKKEGAVGLEIDCPTIISKSDDGKKYHAVFSTASQDRHGEIVYQNFDLKAFRKNPVYLDSHNYGSIENILGKVMGIKSGEVLEGDIEWALDNPKGLLAMKLADGGFLNTSSIGFIPKEFDEEGNITKSELLEISAVSVPANAEALFEKQNGDDTNGDEGDGENQDDNGEDGEDDSEKGGEEIDGGGEGNGDGKDDGTEPTDEELEKIEAEKAVKAEGDECQMDDGSMGEMHPNESGTMVCMPKAKEKAEGDECTLEDGSIGVMARDDAGALVCYPKAVKEGDKEKMIKAIKDAFDIEAKRRAEAREEAVNTIAKYVQKIKGDEEIKRNIFKNLREILSQDIAS